MERGPNELEIAAGFIKFDAINILTIQAEWCWGVVNKQVISPLVIGCKIEGGQRCYVAIMLVVAVLEVWL